MRGEWCRTLSGGGAIRHRASAGRLLAGGGAVGHAVGDEHLQAFGTGDGHLAHFLQRQDALQATLAVDELDRGRLLALRSQELAGPRVDLATIGRLAVELGVARGIGDDVAAAALAGIALARDLLGSCQCTDEGEGGGSDLLVQGSSPSVPCEAGCSSADCAQVGIDLLGRQRESVQE